MTLLRHLANLGYGTRREVEHMVTRRRVTRRDGTTLGERDAFAHDDLLVDGIPVDPPAGTVVVLHKPVGYVCSTKEAGRPLIYELLPSRFRFRSPVMAAVGRLDRDTSGLLLITDDGQLNHRITSPRTRLTKVYEVSLASDLRGDEEALFSSGSLMLEGEPTPLDVATLEVIDARHVRISITEGRYHQVRRMFAAVGNHVVALHRSAVGPVSLGDLPSGQFRLLTDDDAGLLRASLQKR